MDFSTDSHGSRHALSRTGFSGMSSRTAGLATHNGPGVPSARPHLPQGYSISITSGLPGQRQ
jgi:hypothetical protein